MGARRSSGGFDSAAPPPDGRLPWIRHYINHKHKACMLQSIRDDDLGWKYIRSRLIGN